MSFERGGRSNKRGNTYENRFLAHILLRLISEEISSVVIEPLGDFTDICEFYTNGKDGEKIYYQCKASNGAKDHWVPSDLQKNNIFSRVRKLLESDPSCKFSFISPLYYRGLDELCIRAKTCSSAKDFIDHELTNKEMIQLFESCEKYFELSREKDNQLNELVNLLSRCEFSVIPQNTEMTQTLDELIGVFFYGEPDQIRVLLENFVNETASYGVELTASNVLKYLSDQGIVSKLQLIDNRIGPRITQLNTNFKESYSMIGDGIFHRACTDELIRGVKLGKSIILHGASGSGKSGCIHELISYLELNSINYLAIQLDKHMPVNSADKYGDDLGLPGSPVKSLFQLSGSNSCVLILDQLDALRWSSSHLSSSLDVCKEMISHARTINDYEDGRISVVLVSRTYDYENDAGIRSLFSSKPHEDISTSWTELRVENLTDDEVELLIDENYSKLPSRVKELLHIPASLYVWNKLDPEKRFDQLTTAKDIVSEWWKQIQCNYTKMNGNKDSLVDFIDIIVSTMSKQSVLSVPTEMFLGNEKEMLFLVSEGMLILNSKSLSFTHQSFLEAFMLKSDLKNLWMNNVDLVSLVLGWGYQMPVYRYRLSMLLQTVLETDAKVFIKQSTAFLESDQIHYYYKAAVFEIIGQQTEPQSELFKMIDIFFAYSEWHEFIVHAVYMRHAVFLRHLSNNKGYDWSSDEGVALLASVRASAPDLVVSILCKLLKDNQITSDKSLMVLGKRIDFEDEKAFDLRMELYKRTPSLLLDINWIDFDTVQTDHVIQLFFAFLMNCDFVRDLHIYIDVNDKRSFCRNSYKRIVDLLLDCVCDSARKTVLGFHANQSFESRYWLPRPLRTSIIREIVEFVKLSLKHIAEYTPEEAIKYVRIAGIYENAVSNELALSTLLELSIDYSDDVIKWILEDLDKHVLDCISNEQDYLDTCKKILVKHSPNCSIETFKRLEFAIVNWNGDRGRIIETFRERIEYNKEGRNGVVFWPAWGHFQKALLPALDSKRISRETAKLISVLKRNEWILHNAFHAGILSGPVKSVISTIRKSVSRLSDHNWLGIINAELKENHFNAFESEEFYYESSHHLFAQELGACVRDNPVRFAQLLLKFPNNCYSGYYASVLFSLRTIDPHLVDIDLLCDVVRHCIDVSPDSVKVAIIQLIDERGNDNWPNDIISYVVQIAMGQLSLKQDKSIKTGEESFASLDDVIIAVYNNPRALAVKTIASLLSFHPELIKSFSHAFDVLVDEDNSAILFTLVNCIYSFFSYDPEYATCLFKKVIKKSPIVLYAEEAFWIMKMDPTSLSDYYYQFIKDACYSENSKLAEHAARLVCRTAILTRKEQVLDFLFEFSWSNEALEAIVQEATYAFETEEYRAASQTILERLIGDNGKTIRGINRLFDEEKVVLGRDDCFISTILKNCEDPSTVESFIGFTKDKDDNITPLLESIVLALDRFANNAPSWMKNSVEDGLVKMLIRLINEANHEEVATELCLSVLDKLYQKSVLANTTIYKFLDGSS